VPGGRGLIAKNAASVQPRASSDAAVRAQSRCGVHEARVAQLIRIATLGAPAPISSTLSARKYVVGRTAIRIDAGIERWPDIGLQTVLRGRRQLLQRRCGCGNQQSGHASGHFERDENGRANDADWADGLRRRRRRWRRGATGEKNCQGQESISSAEIEHVPAPAIKTAKTGID
jgi:hypothetical protein